MINRIATKMTGSYSQCLSKKSHVSYHIVFITACAKNICLQHERKRGDADATRLDCITSNNRTCDEWPTRCWCVVSVRRRPRSWYDRLAPEAHSTRCSQPDWGPVS